MSTEPFLSYAQNMEDYVLQQAFGDQRDGFYIDVGGGHVVADNVSFHFYAKGWRGIVVEPQARLATAYATVRPRDVIVQKLVGRAEGVVTFYEAADFHGLSTTVAANAATSADNGVVSRQRDVPMTTLASLCAAHAPARIDFLKIDVEGAEAEVIAGNDWTRFRPRVVLVEAVVPWSMADASASFEPLLTAAGYRFALFDNLNRWYVAEEASDIALPAMPADWGAMRHLGMYGPPDSNTEHPDHAVARALPTAVLAQLNTMAASELAPLLPPPLDPKLEATRAALARIAAFYDGGYVG